MPPVTVKVLGGFSMVATSSVRYAQDRVIICLPPFEWAGRQQGSIGRDLLAQCDRGARAEKFEYGALAPQIRYPINTRNLDRCKWRLGEAEV